MDVTRSLGLFVLAGLCEVGGGWLVWQWLRQGRPSWWGLLGAVTLVLYGLIPTLLRWRAPAMLGASFAGGVGGMRVVMAGKSTVLSVEEVVGLAKAGIISAMALNVFMAAGEFLGMMLSTGRPLTVSRPLTCAVSHPGSARLRGRATLGGGQTLDGGR